MVSPTQEPDVRTITQADLDRADSMVGQKVWKNPKTTSKFQPKPFKSGSKVNTVKGVVVHEQTGSLGFTFVEDESVVECGRCSLAPESAVANTTSARGTWTRLEREAAELLAVSEQCTSLPAFICYDV
jgi:hypothetical protein